MHDDRANFSYGPNFDSVNEPSAIILPRSPGSPDAIGIKLASGIGRVLLVQSWMQLRPFAAWLLRKTAILMDDLHHQGYLVRYGRRADRLGAGRRTGMAQMGHRTWP